jgi:hypothetical protein
VAVFIDSPIAGKTFAKVGLEPDFIATASSPSEGNQGGPWQMTPLS